MQIAMASSMTDSNPTLGPIIGVLCMDIAQKLTEIYGDKKTSYLAASYVKWLEAAGARVVPIWINQPREYYEHIMHLINGILLPGGAVFIKPTEQEQHLTNHCVASSKHIYDIALEMNLAGDYFPIWGTCLGMQLMLTHAAGNRVPRSHIGLIRESRMLQTGKDYNNSKIFANILPEIEDVLNKNPVVYHYHQYCVKEADLQGCRIADDWRIVCVSADDQGEEYASVVEHKSLPFFGAQFHPERVRFEQFWHDNCQHTPEAILINDYLAQFFVNECRRSKHSFNNFEEQKKYLIYNFQAEFTGLKTKHWMQCYLFEKDVHYPEVG